jgi:uncharacterized membrane-anchored protein
MRYPIIPKSIIITLFAAVCLVQLFAVGTQIYSYEKILKHGERFIFRATPADPYDPFRGRYVTFNLRDDNVTVEENLSGDAYAVLSYDNESRGIVSELISTPPTDRPYLKADNFWINSGKASVTLPFNRFYMREDLAKKADRLDRETLNRIDASVKVLGGKGVIEELYFEGVPLSDYLKQLN